ncbi:uncharacterized protein LOC114939256 [Nylanderia fulva]|uniref:uncharacterized protein LOC114939256 n=1 Tax=Nylanderia fulva TaxID=613905 RepID=UPI0010FB70AF|nr:uncharacterized protein LOC114939256 [Nylanderia fulva]
MIVFLIDEIRTCLTQFLRKDCDLTKRYCFKKMFHFLRQCLVNAKWEKFKKKPHSKQLIERMATIVAQWLQPEKEVLFSSIKASLNNIKQKVLNQLRNKYPDHLIFSTSADKFLYWENNNIDDNYWNEAEGTQIMNALQEYLFDDFNFQQLNLEDKKLEHSCIDNAVENKCGRNVIFLIIYHSVARRLGLRCDIRQNNSALIIYWKPDYATNSLQNVRCINICTHRFNCHSEYSIIPIDELLLSILGVFEDPPYYNNTFMQTPREIRNYREFIHKRSNQESIVYSDTERQIDKKPKFVIGMIVVHECKGECYHTILVHECKNKYIYEYNDTNKTSTAGVIVGWYINKHKITFVKNETMYSRMHFNTCCNLGDPDDLIHYIILTENNEMCCVNEDALTLTFAWIENSEIGRYFNQFKGTHYVPNKMLAKLYPHDTARIATRYGKKWLLISSSASLTNNDSSNRRRLNIESTNSSSIQHRIDVELTIIPR